MSQSITRSQYRPHRGTLAPTVSVETLREHVEEVLALQGLPGLSVAVTDNQEIVASEQFGLADLDRGTPVSRETYFEYGSIGKTFTAVLVLQLREAGALDLDEPVTRYLPWFEVGSEHGPITIHQLLTHTSGLIMGADMTSDSRFDVWSLRKTEAAAPPGSRYLYSNVGYRALGFVVEEATGLRYADAVRERILDPLGLEATDPEITNAGRHRLAIGYVRRFDDRPARRSDPWVPAPWLETGTGDGCLAGTVDDLADFLRMLLNRGRGLMAPDAFVLMTTPAIEAEDGWWYGYGLELRGREIRHGGSMPGFGATILGDLDAGLGVAVAANADTDVIGSIAEAILELFRDGKSPPPVPDPLTVEDPSAYEGVYSGDAGRLELVARGDRLLLAGKPEVPLEPRGDPGRFLVDRPDLARFLLELHREDGVVVEAVHGGDVYRREGVPAVTPPAAPPEWSAFPGHYRAYNPWTSNFRVVLRGGELIVVFPWGSEWPLVPLADGAFRLGREEWWPERVGFDAVVDGIALRADYCGEMYYRIP
jgi:D-alanyl-D-alanine carboxypeptidase